MKILYSLFPKCFMGMEKEKLAEILQETGFDALDLLIRDGYWVTADNLADTGEEFIRFMNQKGIKVEFATAGFSPEMLSINEEPLKILSWLGIKSFRMSYLSFEEDDIFASLEKGRAQMEIMAELCTKYNIKAVYQIHHGEKQLIHHSFAALYLIKGLPSEYVGVMPDPGNQFHEAHENWDRAIVTLNKYMAGIGVKDGKYIWNPEQKDAPSKGWEKVWAPCQEGVNNWYDIAGALQKIKFDGVLNFQPFYHNKDMDKLIPVLKEELAYIKKVIKDVKSRSESI